MNPLKLHCSSGVLEYWSIGFKSKHYSSTPLLHSYNAPFLRDVFFELVAVFFNECRRGHRRRVTKRTDRVAHDVTADVENQLEVSSFPFTVLNAVKNLFHPVAPLAARSALAARFVSVEARNIPGGTHHASRIVHDD